MSQRKTLTVIVPGRPFSLNAERGGHWSARAARTADYRLLAKLRAREAGCRPRKDAYCFEAVTVDVYPFALNRRYRQDVGNCYPSFKACFDGLVDARVVADDSDEYLKAVTFHPHQYGKDELVLVLTAWKP